MYNLPVHSDPVRAAAVRSASCLAARTQLAQIADAAAGCLGRRDLAPGALLPPNLVSYSRRKVRAHRQRRAACTRADREAPVLSGAVHPAPRARVVLPRGERAIEGATDTPRARAVKWLLALCTTQATLGCSARAEVTSRRPCSCWQACCSHWLGTATTHIFCTLRLRASLTNRQLPAAWHQRRLSHRSGTTRHTRTLMAQGHSSLKGHSRTRTARRSFRTPICSARTA